MTNLVFFSRDPGPTNVLIAVHARIAGAAQDRFDLPVADSVIVFARGPGKASWRMAGIEAVDLPIVESVGDAIRILERARAIAVVTGASDIDEPSDRLLWQAARRIGISCHVFVDHPANLRARLCDASVSPTHVYVPDESFLPLIEPLRADDCRIAIVGDIHIAHIRSKPAPRGTSSRHTVRSAWGASDDDTVLLFASECGREMIAAGRAYAYDELATLQRLIDLVRTGAMLGPLRLSRQSTLIVVRPHPRDTPGKYAGFVTADAPRIVVSNGESPFEAIGSADMVVGMDSTMLREALAVGVAAISLTGTTQKGIPVYGD